MIPLNVKIMGKTDPPSHPGLKVEPELTLTDVEILEGGMSSGNTSVMLILKGQDGKNYYAQTSAALFCTAAAAVDGARKRWKDINV